MNVAVIPARGGSKRIPRKNLLDFCGRPMIVWSIAAAIESGCFDRVIVSTDDAEIADVAREAGAEIPFLRPPALADDFTPTVPVVCHAIEQLEAQAGGARSLGAICCLYATAPFVRATDLERGLTLLRESGSDFAVSVASYPAPIQRALRVNRDGRLEMIVAENMLVRSQDLEPAWHDAGQFYWGTRNAWFSGNPLLGPSASAVTLPRARVQDIDTPEDWATAEAMFRALHEPSR
ncbi:pseudaminic acid cytidylyltransferase [Stakelama pacifica]|uniref:N-acylneuraminate cytidylyltransferase n=1 Tax=Stakelama pacifica TaxID=517720 RepID=A0A4R6FEF4_9SPHN|nr:pseudaminic acid cytidylyltransferase [Stakelama pacifica]TDN79553.1 N-acylneuraminate cytidylyltransferase [Stakelama pacifica]GGP00282.1 pseudaminic acid cytidylyltransferase [Stakelama pacifica]